MQGVFSKPLGELNEDDLRELVNRKLREYAHLDYKREMYDHGWDGKKDLLGDITAMANARGGYILIGVEEDKNEPDGTPKKLVGISDGDQEARWIEDVCIDSIDEKIVGLRARGIQISNGRWCVVVQVPNSPRKPHMISHGSYRSFYRRHWRRNAQMDMPEVRSMIISMSQYQESLEEFLMDRKEAFQALPSEKPWLGLMATPIYVDREKVDPLREDIREILKAALSQGDKRARLRMEAKPRLFGVLVKQGQWDDRLIRLFRNGHLEYCEEYSDWGRRGPKKALPIYSHLVTKRLLDFLSTAREIVTVAEVGEPIAITMYWHNIAVSYLHQWGLQSRVRNWGGIFLWSPNNMSIQVTVNELTRPDTPAQHLIERLFNAFGCENNPHFKEGETFVEWG